MTCINVGFIVLRVLYQVIVVFLRKNCVFNFTSESRLEMAYKLCIILN